MTGIRTLALLNFLITCVNFSWIILIDVRRVFGQSISSTINKYPTYLSPIDFTFTIWIFIAASLSLSTYLMYNGTGKSDRSFKTIRKISKIDYLFIWNQFLCGMSMVFTVNNQIITALLFNIGTIISILLINKRLELKKLTTYSYTRYFTRLAFGMYTGWLMVVLLFMLPIALMQHLPSFVSQNMLFYASIIILLGISAFTLFYSYINRLPAVSSILTWGIYGIVYLQKNSPTFLDLPNIKPWLYLVFTLSALFTLYNFYRCKPFRMVNKELNEYPPSIS